MNARRLTLSLLAVICAAALTGCAAMEGLMVSYTKSFGGQQLTGFVSGGSYGIIGKPVSGKEPVKVNPQK